MSWVYVTMKDGRKFDGPLYMWRPTEGFFSVTDTVLSDLVEIRFEDAMSAVNKGARVGPGNVLTGPDIQDVDLIEKARSDGWNGK